MKKVIDIFYSILHAIIISGIIVLLIGLYYFVIKAGIPYQDPPLDLQIQYEINARIGDILIEIGFKIAVYSSIIRFILSIIWKKYQKKIILICHKGTTKDIL